MIVRVKINVVNVIRSGISQEIAVSAILKEFLDWVIEMRWSTLNVGGIFSWAWVLDLIKGREGEGEWRGDLPAGERRGADHLSSYSSCFKLLLPGLSHPDGLYSQILSSCKPFVPAFLKLLSLIFCQSDEKVTDTLRIANGCVSTR